MAVKNHNGNRFCGLSISEAVKSPSTASSMTAASRTGPAAIGAERPWPGHQPDRVEGGGAEHPELRRHLERRAVRVVEVAAGPVGAPSAARYSWWYSANAPGPRPTTGLALVISIAASRRSLRWEMLVSA